MYSNSLFLRLVSVSRIIFWLSIILMLNPFVLFVSFVEIRKLVTVLFAVGGAGMLISCTVPGILVATKRPWYASAWFQGISLPNKKIVKWEDQPDKLKKAVNIQSIFFLVGLIIAAVMTIVNWFLT